MVWPAAGGRGARSSTLIEVPARPDEEAGTDRRPATLAGALSAELARDVEQLRAARIVRGVGGLAPGGREPGEARGVPGSEEVHDARVAIRRIRSALRAYRPVLDGRWASEVSADLGWLAGQLDPVRDADVRRARLHAGLTALAAGAAPPPHGAVEALMDRLEAEHRAAVERLGALRGTARLAVAARHLEELHASPRISARAAGRAGEIVPRLLERTWSDLRAAARAARSAPGATELHTMRIRAKQLRYGAEVAAPLLGQRAQRLARSCATLQRDLGEHRDALETATWLADASVSPEVAFLAGRLFAEEQRNAAAALENLDVLWRDVRRRWRRFLATSWR